MQVIFGVDSGDELICSTFLNLWKCAWCIKSQYFELLVGPIFVENVAIEDGLALESDSFSCGTGH